MYTQTHMQSFLKPSSEIPFCCAARAHCLGSCERRGKIGNRGNAAGERRKTQGRVVMEMQIEIETETENRPEAEPEPEPEIKDEQNNIFNVIHIFISTETLWCGTPIPECVLQSINAASAFQRSGLGSFRKAA